MRKRNHSNALLVEILIVVLFFMIASTLVIRIFIKVDEQSKEAANTTYAVNIVQNVADMIYTGRDVDSYLTENGYVLRDDAWFNEEKGLSLKISSETRPTDAGEIARSEVSVSGSAGTLVSLPVERYTEKEAGK